MLEQKQMMSQLYSLILPTMQKCGFEPCKTGNTGNMIYDRETASVVDFSGEKGRLRLVYNNDKVYLLSGENDINLDDDSAFGVDSTFLMLLSEYEERDVKSLGNEIIDLLEEKYTKREKIQSKTKNLQTVSKNAARSGALAYDPVTLAAKLAVPGLYPEIKDDIKENIDQYGEFLCEDYFVTFVAPRVLQTIKENNPQKMKKLFGILGDIYEDGTNEVQSLIAVTVLGPVKDDPVLIQNMMPFLTDTMLEPVLSVSQRLKKSKSANLRLENPPKYKPPKQKKSGGLMSMLAGGGAPGQ